MLHWLTKCHVNRTVGGLVMTSCQFSTWQTLAVLYFLYGSGGPPRHPRRVADGVRRHYILRGS